MTAPTGLDRPELMKIIWLSALFSAIAGLTGLLIDPQWSTRFLIVAGLVSLNWYALALIIYGALAGRAVEIISGVVLKPILLLTLLMLGKHGVIEGTSFLAGLNMFFLTLLGYVGARAIQRRRLGLSP